MFNFHGLRSMLALPETPDENAADQLRQRIAELEEENRSLLGLDETIRRNARLFDAILEKCREGILLISPDLIVLRLIHSSVGNREVDVVGQSVLSVIHPDDASSFQKSCAELLNARATAVSCEFRVRKADSWVWLACQMTDLLDDPDIQAILLNVRDMTDQKG